MKHLKSDYEAIVKTIRENSFDSEDSVRKSQLEIVEFVMAFVAELEKRDRQIAKLNDVVSEMGEDIDELLDGLSKNYLDAETGARVATCLQEGMQIVATLIKILEDEFSIDDIKKRQIRSFVEPHLQNTALLLGELAEMTDNDDEEDEDDGEPGDRDGRDGDSDGDGGAESTEEGAAEEEA